MNRNRLCLWLSLAAVACSKVGADSVAPPAPPVYTIQAGFAASESHCAIVNVVQE